MEFEILPEDAIVIVRPVGALTEEDFTALAAAVDTYLETHDFLRGILIHVKEFPGWEDFGGFIGHMRFVRNHHQKILKVAFASDSRFAIFAPNLATHFVSADVRGFDYDDYQVALAWLRLKTH